MTARSMAMTRNRMYFVDFPTTTTYSIIEDTNDNSAPNPGAGDTVLLAFPKTIEYAVTWTGGTIEFDKKGIVEPSATPLGGTICLFTTADPDYDCIVLSQTRITTGKIRDQGGACNADNCEQK